MGWTNHQYQENWSIATLANGTEHIATKTQGAFSNELRAELAARQLVLKCDKGMNLLLCRKLFICSLQVGSVQNVQTARIHSCTLGRGVRIFGFNSLSIEVRRAFGSVKKLTMAKSIML